MHASDSTENAHLSAQRVAAYLDRDLPDTDRAAIEAHAAECTACRAELVEVARLRRARPLWRRWHVLVPAAAAAAVILFLVGRGQVPAGGGEVVRSRPPAEGVPRFAAVSPVPNEPIPPADVVFIWRSAGSEAGYQITVTDVTGTRVWGSGTSDTTARLPASARLERGRSYFWYVDALLPGGQSATSGVREFRTTP
jgi:hypothetical protein